MENASVAVFVGMFFAIVPLLMDPGISDCSLNTEPSSPFEGLGPFQDLGVIDTCITHIMDKSDEPLFFSQLAPLLLFQFFSPSPNR